MSSDDNLYIVSTMNDFSINHLENILSNPLILEAGLGRVEEARIGERLLPDLKQKNPWLY